MANHHTHDDDQHSDDPAASPFAAEVRDRLQSAVVEPDLRVHAYDAGDIAQRSRGRDRRRRTLVSAAAGIAVVAGGLAFALQPDDGEQRLDVAADGAPAQPGGPEFDWQVADGGLNYAASTSGTERGLYALSTAPGTRASDHPDGSVPAGLYRHTDDGWEPIELGADDPRIAEISARGDRLYSLSTSPQTGEPVGAVSADGGENWAQVPLGTIEAPNDTVDWRMSNRIDLASTADTTLAVVAASFRYPTDDLIPEIAEEGAGYYHFDRPTDAGIEVVKVTYSEHEGEAEGEPSSTIGPDGEIDGERVESQAVVRTIPWSELGVSGPADLHQVRTYRVDGTEWTALDAAPQGTGATMSISATDSAILLSTASPEGNVVHRTVDGSSWQTITPPETSSDGWGTTVLAPNGALLHVVEGPQVRFFISNDEGASWTETDLLSLDPDLGGALDSFESVMAQVSSGPLGVAVHLTGHDREGHPGSVESLVFSSDLASWSTADLDELAPAGTPNIGQVIVGADRITVSTAGRGGGDETCGDVDEPCAFVTNTLVATPVR